MLILLSAYNLKPDQVFKKAVSVTFSYDPELLSNSGLSPENIRAKYFNENRKRWMNIKTFTVDEDNHTVTVHTNHFTIISISGQPGFTLSYPSGISGRIQYSTLNSIVSKVNILQDIVINPPDHDIDFDEGKGFRARGSITTAPLNTRNFSFTVNKSNLAENSILVGLRSSRIYLGRLNVTLTGYVPNEKCVNMRADCKSDCVGWWDIFKPLCYGACNIAYDVCQGIVLGTTVVQDYYIDTSNMQLSFAIKRDPVTGVLSVDYNGAPSTGLTFDFVDVSSSDLLSSAFKSIIAEILEYIINHPMVGVGEQIARAIAPEIEKTLNESLADSTTDSPNIVVDNSGIEFQSDITTYLPGFPDNSGNCSADFYLADIPDAPAGTLNLPVDMDIGVGFSLTALNQVFNEVAKRGYFCYNQEVDPTTATVVSINPSAPPTLEYLGNHLMRLRFGVEANISNIFIGNYTEVGTIEIYYRMHINIGANELNLRAERMLGGFTNSTLDNAAQTMFKNINADMQANPEKNGFLIHFSNPMNYAGFQQSMFKIKYFDEVNSMLGVGIDMRGLRIDYGNAGRDYEWIWTKNWRAGKRTCSLFKRGVVVKAPAGYITSHKLLLENGQVLPLRNAGVYSGLFNSVVGQKTVVEGYCSFEATAGLISHFRPTLIYNAYNIVNDHFYTVGNGGMLLKSNHAVQALTDYDRTVGLYEVDIKGNNVPEILQVIQPAPGEYQLDWILSNSCCQSSPTSVNRYSMPLPAEFQADGLYRVEVIARSSGADQLLLNCNVYDVAVDSGQVSLNLAETICSDPYAGVVIDEQNSLMWTQCTIGEEMYSPSCAGAPTLYTTPQSAKKACNNLELGSYTDWRLPTKQEFDAISPQDGDNPLFPQPLGNYWTRNYSVDLKVNVLTRVDKDDYSCPYRSRVTSRACDKYLEYGEVDKVHRSRFTADANSIIRASTIVNYTNPALNYFFLNNLPVSDYPMTGLIFGSVNEYKSWRENEVIYNNYLIRSKVRCVRNLN